MISDLPSSAKLIFLCGPNGSGKSSLFDGMRSFFLRSNGTGHVPNDDYLMKIMTNELASEIFPSQTMPGPNGQTIAMPSPRSSYSAIQFHSSGEAAVSGPNSSTSIRPANLMPGQLHPNSFYFRSAHRNEAEFSMSSIGGQPRNMRPDMEGLRAIDNDAAVSRNYARLVTNSVEDLWTKGQGATTFDEYRTKTIGKVSGHLERLFPGLLFTGIGNPLNNGTFKFDKGGSSDFPYRDLSSGEKAAFDLLLDVFSRQNALVDTVMCIDEPEAHLNARVHGDLLNALFEGVSEKSQLWLASHSIGMMRRARDLSFAYPGSVVFLDFEGHDFDKAVTLGPVSPDRDLWKRALKVALDDIGDLVAPEHIVVCEGEDSAKSLDAECYGKIFGRTHPEAQFVPGGANSEIATDRRGYAYLVGRLTPGAIVTRLVDRDDKSASEVIELLPIKTLHRRNIESYLFADDVLERFAESVEANSWQRIKPLIDQALADAVGRGNPPDDRKPAAPAIYNVLRRELELVGMGSTANALAKERLVHLITPDSEGYKELEAAIF
ncbi:MAG: hypothetical protein DI605_11120 [Sphingomonas sp.]|nr:MAG: hypothetical protein DI605_11120 [Sphingomonas sp.]